MDLFTGLFNKLLLIALILSALLTVACGTRQSTPAPVSHIQLSDDPLPKPRTTYPGRTAIVKSGDNFYSISFLAGFRAQDVARWNDSDPDAKLSPGQKIRLYPPAGAKSERAVTPSAAEDSRSDAAKVQPTAPAAAQTTAAVQPQPAVSRSGAAPKGGWSWPVRGELVGTFSEQHRRSGIDIAGELGTPVQVAANGRVVYAGSGLIGYGRIIIVKHDERFLTVYAHNSRLVANEGDNVRRGQKIAEMGNTDADRVQLHFEIRLDGKPVNPLRFLPKA